MMLNNDSSNLLMDCWIKIKLVILPVALRIGQFDFVSLVRSIFFTFKRSFQMVSCSSGNDCQYVDTFHGVICCFYAWSSHSRYRWFNDHLCDANYSIVKLARSNGQWYRNEYCECRTCSWIYRINTGSSLGNSIEETTDQLANDRRNSVRFDQDDDEQISRFSLFRINNLSTRYRENLELVLKDVTVNVKPGEKVWIEDENEKIFIDFNGLKTKQNFTSDWYHRSNG